MCMFVLTIISCFAVNKAHREELDGVLHIFEVSLKFL